ncbi:MAG: hypothetical protein MUP98_10045, partial [Candidatus Aminicenantes bacterium]|nr:hypothetical protein [Candidatus Aminicenantes bacterium]
MLAGLVRFIFYIILAYFVLKVFRFIQAFGSKSIPKAAHPSKNLSGVMVKDEVCQTYLPKDDAIRELKG